MEAEVTTDESVHFCKIELLFGDVFADAEFTVRGRIACDHACDLTGNVLVLFDNEGHVVQRAEFSSFDGTINITEAFRVKAPGTVGEHAWIAEVAPPWEPVTHAPNGSDLNQPGPSAPAPDEVAPSLTVSHQGTTKDFTLTVQAHVAQVSVWDVPSVVVAGDSFRVKVGAKCSAECPVGGAHVAVFNPSGAMVASARLEDSVFPGTDGLHFAEVELDAPESVGYHRWEARFVESSEQSHRGVAFQFGLNVESRPEFVVTVQAIDHDDGLPIEGANVSLHPFRSVTGSDGTATLLVPGGDYNAYVSGFRYVPFQATIEVDRDVTLKAELLWEPYIAHHEIISPQEWEKVRFERAAEEKRNFRTQRGITRQMG